MLPLDVMDAEVTTAGEDRSGREFMSRQENRPGRVRRVQRRLGAGGGRGHQPPGDPSFHRKASLLQWNKRHELGRQSFQPCEPLIAGGAPAGAPARLEAKRVVRKGIHAAVRPDAAKRARHRRIGR